MTEDYFICPNCNSELTYNTHHHFKGDQVIYCADCKSWFTAEHGEPVCTEECGGDDRYDEDAKNYS